MATGTHRIDKKDALRRTSLSGVKVLAHRLRQQAELLESLSLWEVGQRLAQFLLTEARTNGIRDKRGWHVEITLSKQQIAARVGTVREVIFRALKRLEREGILEIEGRQVTILDEASLEAFGRERG
jgi:CRP-like cAMP-binding protein